MVWLLEKQIEELKKRVTKQGWYVEDTIRLVAVAFKERKPDLAEQVAPHYWEIFNAHLDIVKFSQVVSASFAPHGWSLRFVFGSVLISKALLDIADRVQGISVNASELVKEPELSQSSLITEMFSFAQRMLRKALRIYVDQNIEVGATVCSQNSFIERMYEKFREEVISVMKDNGRFVRRGALLLDIARATKEVSDFSVQIIETTLYIQTARFHKCYGSELREFLIDEFKELARTPEGYF